MYWVVIVSQGIFCLITFLIFLKVRAHVLPCTSSIYGKPGDLKIGKIELPVFSNKIDEMICFYGYTTLPLLLIEGSDDDFYYIQKNFNFTANTEEFYSRLPNKSTLIQFNLGCFLGVFKWKCLIDHVVDSNTNEERLFNKKPIQIVSKNQTELLPAHPMAYLFASFAITIIYVFIFFITFNLFLISTQCVPVFFKKITSLCYQKT